MKKVLIGLGIVILVLAVAVIAAPFFIPTDWIRDQMVAQVKAATGRDLVIRGPVRLSIFPNLEVELNDVAFANAPGASMPQMAELKQLKLDVELKPLLSRNVVVDTLVLVDPVVNLETDRNGRPNWAFGPAMQQAKTSQAQEKQAERTGTPAPAASQGSSQGFGGNIQLGDVRITNGTLTWFDARTGARQQVSAVDVTLSLPSLDAKAGLRGDLTWNKQRVDVVAEIGKARALLTGEQTAVSARIAAPAGKLALSGNATLGDKPAVSSTVDLDLPSIRDAAAWVGKPIDFPNPNTLGHLGVKGKLALAGDRLSFTDAVIDVDAIHATGALTVATGGPRPALSGELAVQALDVNPYLPPEKKSGSGSAGRGGQSGVAQPVNDGWSVEPIDLSGLKAVDADLKLSAGSLQVREIKIGQSALAIVLKDGRLQADLSQLALYQGQGSGQVTLDGRGKVPALAGSFKLSGLQAEPFLTDAMDFDRIQGTLAADIDVTSHGDSQKALIEALDGKGQAKFTDGAIKGINLAAMVRNVSSAFMDSGARSPQKTDFSELGGTFTIDKGIVTNKDLAMQAPLIRLEGSGTVDLPRRTLNYRLEPKAVASLKGQGGQSDLSGIMVPIIVEGPWNQISYRPDLSGLLRGKALEGLKDKIPGGVPTNLLPGLLGQPSGSDSSGSTGSGSSGSGSSGSGSSGSGSSGSGSGSPGLPTPLRNLFGR